MRPVDKKFPISQSYGVPGHYAAGFHTGTDFACPVGTPVVTPHRGVCVKIGRNDKDYGNYIIIRTPSGKRAWLLAHLSQIFTFEGDIIARGNAVGRSGNTGNTTGPHLHAEERHAPFGYRDNQVPTAWNDPGAVFHG